MDQFNIKKFIINFLKYFSLILTFVFFMFPIYVMFSASLKTKSAILSSSFNWIFNPTLDNYIEVFIYGQYSKYFFNTIIIGFTSTIIISILGTAAAYSIARYNLFGEKAALSFLFMRMMPPVAVMTPLFIILKSLNLIDTYTSLIIIYVAFNLPLSIWILLGFFKQIPKELEEAALIDGCTPFQAFYKVALPLVKGGIIASGILVLVQCWNEFPYALIATGSATKTMPVAAMAFKTNEGIHWGHAMSAGSITFIPVLIFALIFQKRLVSGLTGAVKG